MKSVLVIITLFVIPFTSVFAQNVNEREVRRALNDVVDNIEVIIDGLNGSDAGRPIELQLELKSRTNIKIRNYSGWRFEITNIGPVIRVGNGTESETYLNNNVIGQGGIPEIIEGTIDNYIYIDNNNFPETARFTLLLTRR